MKRLWSTSRFIVRQRIRAKKFDRRRRRPWKRHVSPAARFTYEPQRVSHEYSLESPADLKLFDRPDLTLDFCNRLREYLGRRGTTVFLDFSGVSGFTTDALLLIRSIMDRSNRADGTLVRGNVPLDSDVAAEFMRSGFFNGITKPPKDLPEAKGMMLASTADMVHSNVAAKIVAFAMEHATMTKCRADACWQNLVELMTNTHNHAIKNGSRRGRLRSGRGARWFVSVYCRDGVAFSILLISESVF